MVFKENCILQFLYLITEKVHYPLFILAKQVHCLMAEDLNTALTISIFMMFICVTSHYNCLDASDLHSKISTKMIQLANNIFLSAFSLFDQLQFFKATTFLDTTIYTLTNFQQISLQEKAHPNGHKWIHSLGFLDYEMSSTLVQQVNDFVIIYNFYHYEFVSNDRSLP